MKTEDAYWESHVAALNREAISVSAYATRHGLSASALYYWRRKLKVAAEEAADAHDVGKFIALRVGNIAAAPRAGGYTLVLGSGVRLEMPTLPAPEWLAALGCAAGAR